MMETITETYKQSLTKSAVSSASDAFVETLHRLKTAGYESSPRGQAVRELHLQQLEINPLFALPDFKSREFNWKYFAGEMAWYMKGSTGIEYINNFSSFWKGLTNANGSINSNYGNLLFYSNQLIWAYESLVNDKDSRQAISFVSKPDFQYEGNKDFVCTMYLNFWIRENKLNMKVNMRSNDLFYGYSYDVPFFATVMQTMWHNLKETYPELQLGTYHHCADNIHYYERHFELGDKIIEEYEMQSPPMFAFLKEPLFKIYSDHLEFTKSALDFQAEMDSIVESGEITKDNCKNALKHLFIIQ